VNHSVGLRAYLVLFALCHASTATADIVFDNVDPDQGYGTAILSELDTFNQVGDDFELAEAVTVHALEWWGSERGNDFVVRFFAHAAGQPQQEPLAAFELGVLDGTPEEYGAMTYRYGAPIPELQLPAGSYLISIVDQSQAETWFWNASCEDGCEGESWRRPLDGDTWEAGNFRMAFRLFGETTPTNTGATIPTRVLRLANYPNPFNPATSIEFELPAMQPVRLSIFDMRGRLVQVLVDATMAPGKHRIPWNATSSGGKRHASGVYLIRLDAGDTTANRAMVLLK
jgi:hypothetical protein